MPLMTNAVQKPNRTLNSQLIGFEEATILINCVENDYLRKKFGVVYIRRHTVQSKRL